jgi:NTP pyrophosphatase (non-canonical NTP hydrolase)
MDKNDTKPSLEQVERLAILMEECAEVQQVIGKIFRHGWRTKEHCNRIGLEHEVGDLVWSIKLLCENSDLDINSLERFIQEKPAKVAPFLHFTHKEVK